MASFSVLSLPFFLMPAIKPFIREGDTLESIREGLIASKKGAICLFRTHLYLSKVCGNISPASFFCSTQCQSSAIKGVFSPSDGGCLLNSASSFDKRVSYPHVCALPMPCVFMYLSKCNTLLFSIASPVLNKNGVM